MFQRNFHKFGPFTGTDPGDFGAGFPGRLRAGRGMMEPAILQVLLDGPRHGYEIITTLEERSHGMWRPSPGSVYPTLQLLEEKDYLTSQDQAGKKIYTLTEVGKQAAESAKEHHRRHEEVWQERLKSFHGAHEYHEAFGKAMHLLRDIVHDGSDDQKQQLKAAVADFTAALERIQKHTP